MKTSLASRLPGTLKEYPESHTAVVICIFTHTSALIYYDHSIQNDTGQLRSLYRLTRIFGILKWNNKVLFGLSICLENKLSLLTEIWLYFAYFLMKTFIVGYIGSVSLRRFQCTPQHMFSLRDKKNISVLWLLSGVRFGGEKLIS